MNGLKIAALWAFGKFPAVSVFVAASIAGRGRIFPRAGIRPGFLKPWAKFPGVTR